MFIKLDLCNNVPLKLDSKRAAMRLLKPRNTKYLPRGHLIKRVLFIATKVNLHSAHGHADQSADHCA